MRKTKKMISQSETMKKRWSIRIMLEKGYTQECARWMAERLEKLIDHMRYGHAAIAYRRQDGTFRLVTGTLIYYERKFHKKHDINRIDSVMVYWDVEQQAWRTFQVENFMEWKPIV